MQNIELKYFVIKMRLKNSINKACKHKAYDHKFIDEMSPTKEI